MQNARKGEGATSVPPEAETPADAILRGFAADMGPAAEKINLLLKRLDAGEDVREDAAKLAEELPSLMPGDPAMAAVLEEAMAEEFAETVADKGAVKNSTDANGAEHADKGSGNGGQFVGKDGGGGKSEEAQTESGDKKPFRKTTIPPERTPGKKSRKNMST